MEHSNQTQATDIKDIEEMIAQLDEMTPDYDANAAAQYEPAFVSASLTKGPAGVNVKGWITFRSGGRKVYFENTRTDRNDGLPFAGGGAELRLTWVPRDARAANYVAVGNGGRGNLQLSIGGRQVFVLPLMLTGVGLGGWAAAGEVKLEQH